MNYTFELYGWKAVVFLITILLIAGVIGYNLGAGTWN